MNWSKAKSTDSGVTIPDNWLFLHYYEALSVLFKIENALRSLVYIVLKNHKGTQWTEITISSDDATQTTIGALAKKRISQSQNYGYLGYQISSPMMQLTSGELVRLLTSDAYWPLFKRYFRASKQVVTLKLEEIGTIRNSLAHFRPLTSNDVEVVKQNANQVLSAIEATLNGVLAGGQRVPSNTADEWYLNLRSMRGKQSQITHNQSLDSQWIRATMDYRAPIISLSPPKPDTYVIYTVLNVNPVGILNQFTTIREYVTCVLESIPLRVRMPENFKPEIRKQVHFIFSLEVLKAKHPELKPAFEAMIAHVDSEANLIADDNLARGEVVYISETQANLRSQGQDEVWRFNLDALQHPISESDPPEYWGSTNMYTDNFVSDAHRFPWMPVPTSSETFPF